MGTPNFFPIQNFVAVPYKAALISQNVQLLTTGTSVTGSNTAGIITQSGHQSQSINTQMDWLNTYTGQAVSINMQSGGTSNQLDKILMLYIDNSQNPSDVTVYFLDTLQAVNAPAFTTGYYPVFTSNLFFNVYNGITGVAPVTATSKTAIIICNFAVPGFLSLDTLNVTFNSSTGPKVPVLGDTALTYVMNTAFPANPVSILPLLALPQQYVITGLEVNATNLYLSALGGFTLAISLSATGKPTSFRQFNIDMRPEYNGSRFFNICDETGLNYPCQNLVLFTINLAANTPATIPSQSAITICVTYATVTL